MHLDRNTRNDGGGKYLVINLRKLGRLPNSPEEIAEAIYNNPDCIDAGQEVGGENESFVIKLKDKFAQAALDAYANEAGKVDPEYATEIRKLAGRAGPHSRYCKKPD